MSTATACLHDTYARLRGVPLSFNRNRGFTIIELLIVVVVIGILGSIVIVSYQGIQQKARNTARVQTVNAIRKNFLLYEAEFGKGPMYQIIAAGNSEGQCIGTDYEDVDPTTTYSCRYLAYDSGATTTTPANQAVYDALRIQAKYSMNYSPVTQRNFSGITTVTSSAPFITLVEFSSSGLRFSIDNGPLRDYYSVLSYRLEGVDRNCQLPVVRISSQTATQRNLITGQPYSVTNGGATECWVLLDI